jgi:hypothetical protein
VEAWSDLRPSTRSQFVLDTLDERLSVFGISERHQPSRFRFLPAATGDWRARDSLLELRGGAGTICRGQRMEY